MSRGSIKRGGVCLAAGLVLLAVSAPAAQAGEDPRTVIAFLKELKERGLYEQALDYLAILRADNSLPKQIRDALDYEEGRALIDEAAGSNDLVRKQALLEEAHEKLDLFTKTHPQAREARDALVQIARMLVERGHLALLVSSDAKDEAKKQAKLAEARANFSHARDAYAKAIEPLTAAYKKFAGFIPERDPRREERDEIYAALLDATLQKGVADYELAQTFPADSADRKKAIKDALDQFDALYKNYRSQLAGMFAQMWQARCYEEQGNIGAAIGIYKQLLEHSDPHLRSLQRSAAYFYIVALGKRKEYALAADQCTRWLETYNRKEDRRSRDGLGVLFEMARDVDAQMPGLPAAEQRRAARTIVDAVAQVVRYASPFKNESLALLKKYKPSSAMRAEEVARLTYQDTITRAEEALAEHEWERAIGLFKAAIAKADPRREIDNANYARYELAFAYYMNKQFYEADVLAEHLARRYPQGGLSAKATQVAMQALADAYNSYTEIDRISDIDRLVDLARYTAETWPGREEGDDARMNLGLIYTGRGEYDKAIEILSAVRPRSPKWVDAQTRLGVAHWARSRDLERRGESAKAKAETQQALDGLYASLKSRRSAGAGPTDPGLAGNAGDLAIVLTETGKAADALALLEPIIQAQTVRSGPVYSRLMEAALSAYVASNQVEKAIDSMKSLEQGGGAAGKVQLYFKLGKLLEHEIDALKEKKDMAKLGRLHTAYRTFLTTMAESKTNHTYESLQWAGESLLRLDSSQEAEKVFRRIINEFTQDPQFLQQATGRGKLLRTKLRLAAALRNQIKFDEANSLVDELLAQKPPYIECLFEKGLLLEAEAEAHKESWSKALAHWEKLAQGLVRVRPRPPAYYDALYHQAFVFYKLKDPVKARQTLQGVMTLSPHVGSPEMEAKYKGLLARLR
jgi:outer membrane protein assembly factor BamD (BamD/ComL family)